MSCMYIIKIEITEMLLCHGNLVQLGRKIGKIKHLMISTMYVNVLHEYV